MNLWVKQIGLILGLALFIFACEEPGEIGLDINPEQENFVVRSLEIPVEGGIGITPPYYVRDAVGSRVYTSGRAWVGKYTYDDFGSYTLESYLEPNLFVDSLRLKEGSVLDTVELRLYLDNFYGYEYNITGPQKINLYELSDSLPASSKYDNQHPYGDEPLAQITFELDTVVASKFISVDLPLDFGHKVFDEAINDTLLNDHLLKIFAGFAFVPADENDIIFNVSSQSFLVYDYRESSSYPSDSAKSFILNFVDISSLDVEGNPSYDMAVHYSHIDLTGTALNEVVPGGPLNNTQEKGYLHPLLGSYVEIDFSPLLALRDSLGAMVINDAVFSIENIPYDTAQRYLNTINVFEKGEDFDFSHLALFAKPVDESYGLGENLKFTMGRVVNEDDELQSFFVNGVARNSYTPVTRNPLFEDYLQSIMSDPKYESQDELKMVMAPAGLGASLAPVVFDKTKIKFKIYFTHFKNQ